jgi:hypothetical protein
MPMISDGSRSHISTVERVGRAGGDRQKMIGGYEKANGPLGKRQTFVVHRVHWSHVPAVHGQRGTGDAEKVPRHCANVFDQRPSFREPLPAVDVGPKGCRNLHHHHLPLDRFALEFLQPVQSRRFASRQVEPGIFRDAGCSSKRAHNRATVILMGRGFTFSQPPKAKGAVEEGTKDNRAEAAVDRG